MVIRIFMLFVWYLLQLPLKITILACRWMKLLTYFVIFWEKQQLMMYFIQNLELDFHSFLDLFLYGNGSQLTIIGGISNITMSYIAWKVSVFGVILVHIFPHLDWIRTRITLNTDTFYAVLLDRKSAAFIFLYIKTTQKFKQYAKTSWLNGMKMHV